MQKTDMHSRDFVLILGTEERKNSVGSGESSNIRDFTLLMTCSSTRGSN